MEYFLNYLELKESDGTFFTKDNVQVYTIYFENVPECEGTYEQLQKYFSKYGRIQKLRIEERYYVGEMMLDCIKISGTVQYVNPESAFGALIQMHKFYYVVISADSWLQPTVNSNYKYINENCNENQCPLINLNEDCIMYIFSILSLQDIILLTTAFSSLKPIVKQYFKMKKELILNYKEIYELTLMQVRQFLIDNGENIEKLEIIANYDYIKSMRYLNLALHFCTNIKSLSLSSIPFMGIKNSEFSWRISTRFLKLEKLILINCILYPQDVMNLSKLTSLKLFQLT